jgi:hypothetical protein
MILTDPLHQKVLNAFSKSAKWFRKQKLSRLSAISTCEKATKKLRHTGIGKKYKGFWNAAFPKKGWAIAFGIFAGIVAIMLTGGLIFS